MHTLILTREMQLMNGQVVAPGQYLVDDLNAAEMMVMAERGTAQAHHFSEVNIGQLVERDSKRVLVVHPGGYGDQMMLTPALRAHKRQHPDLAIDVCCRAQHRCTYEGLGYPDGFVDYPLDLRAAAFKYRGIFLTENMNEGERGRTHHAVDNKAAIMGVDLGGDTAVEYRVSEQEAAWAEENYPRVTYRGKIEDVVRPRIAIQLAASAPNRTYSHDKLGVIFGKLYDAEWELLLLGTPGSTDQKPIPEQAKGRVRDLAQERRSFRQSAAVVATCNVVLAPDSAIMHVAGALGVPCVALFGPINWELRTKYYPSVRAIQGFKNLDGSIACPMQPCFFHQRGGLFFPKDGPCFESGHCESIDSINPLVVLDWIGKIRTK